MKVNELRKRRDVVGLSMLAVVVLITMITRRNVSWMDPFYYLQSLFAGKGFMQPEITWTIVFLGGAILLLFLLGRVFCGWFCPFAGFLKVFDRVPIKKRPAPEPLNDRNLKYFILIGFLFAAVITGFTTFAEYCPAGALFRGLPGGGGAILTAVPVLLGIVGIALYYGGRTWCKSLCPLGAFFAACPKPSAGLVKVRNPQKCTKCLLCQTNCPMDVLVAEKYVLKAAKKIKDRECINCYNCVVACPMKILNVV